MKTTTRRRSIRKTIKSAPVFAGSPRAIKGLPSGVRHLLPILPLVKGAHAAGMSQADIAFAIKTATGRNNSRFGAYGKRLKESTLAVYVNQAVNF